MPRPFIHDDFLLDNDAGRDLYHQFASRQPIFDYHCHLPVEQIASNHQFADLYEIWLAGDHYKWRGMRANGVAERFCTGDAPPYDKFRAYAATVPYLLRNPLYHWSHLELTRYFGIDVAINAASAPDIWSRANALLPGLRTQEILAKNRVAVVCTTDDPADSLDAHNALRKSGLKTRVYPAFRPDRAFGVDDAPAFNGWLERLEQASGARIGSFDDLLGSLKRRHDAFHRAGCRLSDHGLEQAFAEPCTHSQAKSVFQAAREGRPVDRPDRVRYCSYLMLEFGRWDAAAGWTKQLHLGALRNNHSRQRRVLGPDTGFDCIGDFPQAEALVRYMDALDSAGSLPRMVIYNVNPSDNYLFASVIGSFQDGTLAGKLQFGSGWWHLDQKEGIEWQINALSNLGLLRRFVGMLTDSRSFLSYPRHEYFRRVLCNLLGREMEAGLLPQDRDLIGSMVREISFTNARDHFGLEIDASFLA